MKRTLAAAGTAVAAATLLLSIGCSGSETAAAPESDAGGAVPATQAGPASMSAPAAATAAAGIQPPPDTTIDISATDLDVFQGEGNSQTSHFNIVNGILYLKAEHRGNSEFTVRVLTDRHLASLTHTGGLHSGTGSPRGAVVSIEAIGNYSGVRAHQVSPAQLFGLTPGTYLMHVVADGPWKVELSQPVWSGGESPPFEWSGNGDDVRGPIGLDQGTFPVKVTYSGSSDFVVELFTADGNVSEKLVNNVGAYDGTVEVKIHPIVGLTPDIYGLAVTADGEWTMSFGEQ